ncbi:MAG: hypothetical protein J6A25_00930 [Lachnospiraceae bacterium]|nr:hypothetical protein [Lachnospiraceae bacterium]
MANNTTGMSDFEKYPKYQLDKHGKVIKQILNTAESVFGMAEEKPVIKNTVGGGQYIVNEDNKPAVFTDDFLISEPQGIIYISPINKSVAIANYAKDEDIINMFKSQEEGDDNADNEAELTPAPAPIIAFSSDKTRVFAYKLDIDGNPTAEENTEPLYYFIETDILDNVKTSHSWYQAAITLPEFDSRKCSFQVIGAITPGDDFKTNDSEPALLYRISPGLPVSSAYMNTDTGIKTCTIKKPTDDFLEVENKVPILNNPELVNKVIYWVDSYDYETGTTSLKVQEGEVLDSNSIELNLGEVLFAKIDCQLNPSVENATFNTNNTLILTSQIKHTNFRTLQTPNILYNTTSKIATISHVDAINPEQVTGRGFVFSIQRYNESTWSAEQVIYNDDPIEIPLAHIGDTIRVKSIAQFYNDSSYSYKTACEHVDDDTPGDSTQEELFVDFAASDIVTAEYYEPQDADWYGGDFID